MDLGKLKIEYKRDGNTVQIFNSPTVCSLVINGRVADTYNGMVATKFILEGTIDQNGEQIIVAALMGHLFMELYYGNKRVAKKFMGLG